MSTYRSLTGDGSTTQFDLTFPYMDKAHVHAFVNDSEVSFTWVSGTRIQLSPAPAAGSLLLIKRVTPVDQALVNFQDGAVLSAADLNLADRQLLYRQQEDSDSLAGETTRSLKVPLGETSIDLPAAASRADTVFGFDLAGTRRLFSSTALSSWLLTSLLAMLPGSLKGDPGGNALSAGAFTALSSLAVTSGTDVIRTSEYRPSSGRGGAFYRYKSLGSLSADQAYASAHPSWAAVTSNGRLFVLDDRDQYVRFEMFGAYGDGTTDDFPAWLAAKDFLDTLKATHVNAYYKSVPELQFGRFQYKFSDSIDLTDGVYSLKGAGPHAFDMGGNTQFLFASGKNGFIFQSWDTSGVSSTVANSPKGSAYSHVSDIAAFSLGGTLRAEQHGFLIKAPVTLERCFAYNFGGNGFYIRADVTGAGNANVGKLIDCGAMNCGLSGLKTIGGDSNAWDIRGFNASNNTAFGIDEESFLGNHYYGFHIATNGTTSSGPDWAGSRPTGGAILAGHLYTVVIGQEAAASTNSPSGTTTSNTWWNYYGEGVSSSIFRPWVSGMTWVAGGAFLVSGDSNKSGVFGGYMETNQLNGLSLSARALIIAGGFSSWRGAAQLNAHGGRIWSPNFGTGLDYGDGIDLTTDKINFGSVYLQRVDSETVSLRGGLDSSIRVTFAGSSAAQPYAVYFPAGLNATIPVYANNAAAIAGGLPVGGAYRTSTGQAMWRY